MITITTTKSEQKLVQYTADGDGLVFMDTLIFTPEEYEKLDDSKIEKIITDKFNIWSTYVKTPTPIPTKADKEAELEKLTAEKIALENKITLLTSEISKIK
jgi:predicted phage-related endonuclease